MVRYIQQVGAKVPVTFAQTASRGYMYGANNMYSRMIADYRMSLEKGFDPSQFIIDKSDIADMWFGGMIYMDIVINRFLSNTAEVTRNENWLRTFCDRNRVTRAEIETFYRNNIRALVSQVVDEKARSRTLPSGNLADIKRVITDFYLVPNATTYNEMLSVYRRYRGFDVRRNIPSSDVFIYSLGELSPATALAIVNNRSASDLQAR